MDYTAEIYPVTERLGGIPYAAGDIVDYEIEETGEHYLGVVWKADLGLMVQPLFERLPHGERLESHSLISLDWLAALGDVKVVGTYEGEFSCDGKMGDFCFAQQSALQDAYVEAQERRLAALEDSPE